MEEQGCASRAVLLQRPCSQFICFAVFQPQASLGAWWRHLAKVGPLPSQKQSQTIAGAGYSPTDEMWYLLSKSSWGRESRNIHSLNVMRAMKSLELRETRGMLCFRVKEGFRIGNVRNEYFCVAEALGMKERKASGIARKGGRRPRREGSWTSVEYQLWRAWQTHSKEFEFYFVNNNKESPNFVLKE